MSRGFVRLLCTLALATAVIAACDHGGNSSDGSTSWFARCEADEDCSGGLVCLCGICSRGCAAARDCAGTARSTTCVELAGGVGASCRLSFGSTARAVCLPACDAGGGCPPGLACDVGICIPPGGSDPDGGRRSQGGNGGSAGTAPGGAPGAAGSSLGGSGTGGRADVCGDGIATGREACDGVDLRGATCAELGFDIGFLACNAATCRYNFDGCGAAVPTLCGNAALDPGEECDGADLRGLTCEDLGLKAGTLECTQCRLSTAGCPAPMCGDGVAGRAEVCDGDNLRGKGCKELGYPSGTLSCKADCTLDETGCEPCGDGRIEQGEACDGAAFGSATCIRAGFAGGALKCSAKCQLDDSGCSRCGNGAIEPGESCDGADLGGATCESLGLASGPLRCSTRNCLFDLTGCGSPAPKCGNSVTELGEECDGKDLRGIDCGALGFEGGNLKCAASCRFETAGCVLPPPVDLCKACRERQCRTGSDKCKADPGCTELFACMNACAPSTDDMCWFYCGNTTHPTPEGLPIAESLYTCMIASCTEECGGSQ